MKAYRRTSVSTDSLPCYFCATIAGIKEGERLSCHNALINMAEMPVMVVSHG